MSSVAVWKCLILSLNLGFISEVHLDRGHACEQRRGMHAHVPMPCSHTQHSRLRPGFRDTLAWLVLALSLTELPCIIGPPEFSARVPYQQAYRSRGTDSPKATLSLRTRPCCSQRKKVMAFGEQHGLGTLSCVSLLGDTPVWAKCFCWKCWLIREKQGKPCPFF